MTAHKKTAAPLLCRLLTVGLSLLTASVLGSCAGQQRDAVLTSGADNLPADSLSARAVQLELPAAGKPLAAPSELLRSISTTPSDIDRVIGGGAFNGMFSNRVTPTATADLLNYWYEANASYTPDYVKGVSKSLDDAAYGQYWFDNFGTATGDYDVYVRWLTPPAPGTAFIGLSDWDRDAWVWYPIPASGRFSVSDTQRFVSDGPNLSNILLATVMLTGTTAHELDYVLVGDPTNPPISLYTDLSSDVTQNIAPRIVNFQVQIPLAGASVDTIELDLDGQPGYEIADDEDGMASFDYTVPGDYTVRMRITDNLDRVFSYEDDFTIVNPNNQLPIAMLSGSVASGPAPLEVTWDASASMDPDGSIISYRWNIDADSDWDFTTTEPTLTCSYGYEGQIFCGVEVQDNDFAQDYGSDFVDVTDGWKVKLLETTVEDIDSLDICQTFGGGPSKAVLAYSCYQPDRIYTISSVDSAGINWNSIQELAYTGDRLGGIDPSICALASGTPVIAFGEEKSQSDDSTVLKLAKATNWAADAWNAPITIDTDTGCGEDNCIELIDGKPSIVSRSGGNSSSSRLHYYRCADALGNAWGLAQMIGPLGPATIGTPAMFDASTGPVLAVDLIPPASNVSELNIIVATDASGTSWGNQTIWSGERADFLSFAPDDSLKPILVYGHASQGAVLRKLRGSADGHTWPGLIDDLTPPAPRSGGACEIAVWNGFPIICYQSYATGELMAVQSLDTQGTFWGEPYSVWTLGHTGDLASMTVVSGLFPVMVFCTDVATGSELWVAYWDGP